MYWNIDRKHFIMYFSLLENGDDSIKTLEARNAEFEEIIRKWVNNRKRKKYKDVGTLQNMIEKS